MAADAAKPVIAHRFLNYILDNKVAYDNFAGYVGYQPPITAIDGSKLFEQEHPPEVAEPGRRHARGLRQRQRLPDALGQGPAALGPRLDVVPQRLRGRAGSGASSPFPASPGWRSSSRRLLRDHQRRPRQRHHALRAGPALEPAGLERRLHLGGAEGRRAGRRHWHTFLRTIIYVVVAVILSLAIGYPVAWYAARHAGRWRGPILVLLVLPFWISYLMRMFAWTNLLADNGYATRALHALSIDRLFRSGRPARQHRLARLASTSRSSSPSSTATCPT